MIYRVLLAVILAVGPACARAQTRPLLIAPHIDGVTFCDSVVNDPKIVTEEQAAAACTVRGQNSAGRINKLLDSIGPALSPSGHFALGYLLDMPLMRYYTKEVGKGWVPDKRAIQTTLSTISDVNRPVVIYLSANHFTDGGIELSNELAANPVNLMWTKSGPLKSDAYFDISLHAWTLVDPDAPITVMRRTIFNAVLDEICRLNEKTRSRIAGVSVLGEIHQLYTTFPDKQGYDAGFDITDYSPQAIAGFHEYLAAKFGSIAALDTAAGAAFRSFDEVPAPSKDIRHDMLKSFFEHIDPFAAGVVAIQGWAFDPSGAVTHIAVYLDGKLRGTVPANLNRSDVPEAVPSITTPNVGWRYNLDYHAEAPGVHTLEVFRVAGGGRLIRMTKRGLTVVARDQGPSRQLPSAPVDADDPDPKSPVQSYIDGPPPLTPLFYNPVARWWLEYRNKVVADYIKSFADLAGKSCLSHDVIFSHQLAPQLNSSWDSDLMAVDASQVPNASYHQGTTLYGGAAFGQAFFDWKNALGWKEYAVAELHPRFNLPLAGFEKMFEDHRNAGARYVAPYFMSIKPARVRQPLTDGLNRVMITPENHQLGSDIFYEAIADTMQRR
jgi:hypothetical protein